VVLLTIAQPQFKNTPAPVVMPQPHPERLGLALTGYQLTEVLFDNGGFLRMN
jgi:hypothetical protein